MIYLVLLVLFIESLIAGDGEFAGGSSGIGYQTALQFAQDGGYVIFTARDNHPDWYTGAEAEVKINNDEEVKQSGGFALFYKADMSNYTQAMEAIDFVYTKTGRLDVAANIAGIGGPTGYNVADIPPELIHGVHDPIRNNVYHVLYGMMGQLKAMNSSGKGGSIINVSSYNGLRACAQCSMYSASKHAIIGLTKSAAMEYSDATPRIRVNAIAPGLIDTPLTRNQVTYFKYGKQTWDGPLITEDNPDWIEMKPSFEKDLVGHKLGKPSEMANVIMFLASEKASYVNGEVFSADFASTAQ